MAYLPIRGTGSGLQFLNFPFGDTTYTKVFVGGLAWETQSETLRSHFEQFGEILEAVVITDKHTGRSKGYGFVTFRDPEAAKRACADPSPIIDGRRANCNLASLGRPQPSLPYGHQRSALLTHFGSVQTPRSAYISSSYPQSMSYTYQPGIGYPPYGYRAYGPEYVYPQGAFNPYLGQQYIQMYGVPGTINPSMYSYGQMGHSPSGRHGYAPIQGFMMPGHNILQYGGHHVSAATTETVPTIQAPYHTGIAGPTPRQARIVLPAPAPQLARSSSSDQMAG